MPAKPQDYNYQYIDIGTPEQATALYAYPNNPSLGWSLEQTIEHWMLQTLERDGYAGKIIPKVMLDSSRQVIVLVLEGDDPYANAMIVYGQKLYAIYQAGLEAHDTVIPLIKKDGLWDPRHKDWRFFMPMGLPMVSAKALQFFHYPPEKMLNNLQNYLNDPVPYRVENLLVASGVVDRAAAQQFECIVDGAPIAAPDDAGSAKKNSHWGYIPINYFEAYQKAMILALLNHHPDHTGWTVPIMVYGNHPNEIFSKQFLGGKALGQNKPQVIEIIPGLKTPVMGSKHPYGFYWTAQVGSDQGTTQVGSGKMLQQYCEAACDWMISDLVSTGWLEAMAEDPTQDGAALVTALKTKWTDQATANKVCAMVQSEATLYYKDAAQTDFAFRISETQAASDCAANGNVTCSFIP